MSRRMQGIVLIAVGVVVALAAVLADVVRIGMLPGTFGAVQIGGTVLGVALVIWGVLRLARKGT